MPISKKISNLLKGSFLMAEYNLFQSTVTSDLFEGTESADSISVYGNHSTIKALGGDDRISVNGGRHDNGIWIGDGEKIFGGKF